MHLLMLEAVFGLAAFAVGCVVYGTVSQLQTCNSVTCVWSWCVRILILNM